MSGTGWISHNDARELVGRAYFGTDWIGNLDQKDIDLLHGKFGPKRWPRPNGSSGFFEIIAPCSQGLRSKLDAAIGRDRRWIIQHTTVLEWLDQNGFPALEKRYSWSCLQHAVAKIVRIVTPTSDARPPGAGKRGPIKGTIARFAEHDRSMFPQMKRLIDQGLSMTAAAEQLAEANQLKGGGTCKSRATRLRKLFQQEFS